MLAQHVEPAGARDRRILRALARGGDGGDAFQHLESVGRHEQGARRFVQPVIGAADALHQPARALRRADVDDEIDIAPVDAEIERRGADDRAQAALGHGGFHLAPLARVERAVMQRDRQRVLVDAPQFLEDEFGLRARVDEDERHLRAFDRRIDFSQRMARAVAGPRQALLRVENGEFSRRAGRCGDEIGDGPRPTM